MRFRDDNRAVTVQIGAILLFATFIIALSMYQMTIVPSQNADIEYKHSQQVQGEFTDIRNAIIRTAATGTTQPASLTLGTQYPSRVFLMNPPPATGTLRTGTYDASGIQLENIVATSPAEANGYFAEHGNAWEADTKYLAYEPNYNEFDTAPQLLYESSLVSNYYPNSEEEPAVPLSDQLLVNEASNTITLVALNGSLGTTRAGSVSVNPDAVSAPAQGVEIERDGGPIQLTVPTAVDANTLTNRTSLETVDNIAGEDRVRITLADDGPYTLRTATVGVGSQTTSTDAAYLTVVDSDDDSVTVEVRDHFNNPKRDVAVNVTAPNPFSTDSKRTNGEGQATFEAAPGEFETATLQILGGTAAYERINTTVDTRAETGAGASGAYDVSWTNAAGAGLDGCDSEYSVCQVNADNGTSITLTASVLENGEVLTDATVDYARNGSSFTTPGALSLTPPAEATGPAGTSTTRLDVPAENGTVRVYAASGGDADHIDIRVRNPGDGATDPGMAFEDMDGDGVYEPGDGDFTVDLAANNYQYDATTGESASLVVPEGVTLDSPQSIDLAGENVTLRTDATAAFGLSVTATQGNISAQDVALTSGNGNTVTLDAAAGTVNVDGSTVESASSLSMNGGVSASNGDISTNGAANIGDGSGTLAFTNGVIDTTAGTGSVTFSGTSLDATGLTTTTRSTITVDVPAVSLTGADFDATGTIEIGTGGGPVSLTDGDVDTATDYGEITVSGTETTVSGTQLAAVSSISVTANNNPVEVTNAELDTSANSYGGVAVSGSGATVTASQVDAVETITITGTNGPVDVSDSTLDNTYNYAADITLNADTSIDVRAATLRSDGAMSGTRGAGAAFYVDDASFLNGAGNGATFDISRENSNIVGEPANGTVV